MNKLYYLIAVVLSSFMLLSCSDNEPENVGGSDDNTEVPPTVEGELAPHPRLLLKKGEEPKVFNLVVKNESFHAAHMYILEYSNKVMTMAPQTYKLDGKRLLAVSSEVLTRVYFLSYMYRITGLEKYAERAEEEMLAVSAFKDWNPQHFLDVGEMAMAVAIGYDWLYDYLSDETKEILRKAIVEKAFMPSETGAAWFYTRESNWNQVCNAGLVLAALAIYEDETEWAEKIINKAVESVKQYGHGCYKPDGAYAEGFAYWGYGTGFEVMMITAMETALGTDFGLSEDESLMRSPFFVLYSTAPTGFCYNYSDSDDVLPFQHAMYWFAARTNNPSLLIYELNYLKEVKSRNGSHKVLPNVFIFSKDMDLNSLKNLKEPDENYWVSGGNKPLFIYKSGWNDKNDVYLGVVGGKANQSHGHMDAGSFIYEKNGVRWALELGLQSYSTLENSGADLDGMGQNGGRWNVFRYGRNGHSIIVINNKNLIVDAEPQIDAVYREEDMKGAMLDLSGLYNGEVEKVSRTVFLDGKNDLHVKDYFKTNGKKAEVQWMMVTVDSAVKIGNDFIIEKDGSRMLMSIIVNKGDIFPLAERLENNGEALEYYDAANPGTCRLGYTVTLPADGEYEIEVALTEIK